MSKIRAISFDVGGTLIEPWPSVGHVYADVAAQHGCRKLDVDRLSRQFNAAWKAKTDFNYSRDHWLDLVRSAFEGQVAESEVRAFFDHLYHHFGATEPWRVFEDVRATLQVLASRGLRLAVISNWDDRLPGLLEALDLRKHFEVVTVSFQVGHIKPSPEIFHHTAVALGLDTCAMLHVGDNAVEDGRGARDAGMQSVLIRRGAPFHPGTNTDENRTIERLDRLAELLENI